MTKQNTWIVLPIFCLLPVSFCCMGGYMLYVHFIKAFYTKFCAQISKTNTYFIFSSILRTQNVFAESFVEFVRVNTYMYEGSGRLLLSVQNYLKIVNIFFLLKHSKKPHIEDHAWYSGILFHNYLISFSEKVLTSTFFLKESKQMLSSPDQKTVFFWKNLYLKINMWYFSFCWNILYYQNVLIHEIQCGVSRHFRQIQRSVSYTSSFSWVWKIIFWSKFDWEVLEHF